MDQDPDGPYKAPLRIMVEGGGNPAVDVVILLTGSFRRNVYALLHGKDEYISRLSLHR